VANKPASDLKAKFPNVEHWVFSGGWIEIGKEPYLGSFVRAYDEGGMVWEGDKKYKTLEETLRALDDGIGAWLDEIE